MIRSITFCCVLYGQLSCWKKKYSESQFNMFSVLANLKFMKILWLFQLFEMMMKSCDRLMNFAMFSRNWSTNFEFVFLRQIDKFRDIFHNWLVNFMVSSYFRLRKFTIFLCVQLNNFVIFLCGWPTNFTIFPPLTNCRT